MLWRSVFTAGATPANITRLLASALHTHIEMVVCMGACFDVCRSYLHAGNAGWPGLHHLHLIRLCDMLLLLQGRRPVPAGVAVRLLRPARAAGVAGGHGSVQSIPDDQGDRGRGRLAVH